MESKIHYSRESLRDLDDIWEYVSSELQNPAAAKRTIDKILDAIDRLDTFPAMGSPLSAIVEGSGDYRFLLSGNYMIFYRSYDDGVYIDRVLYGRRDYLRVLFGDALNSTTDEQGHSPSPNF